MAPCLLKEMDTNESQDHNQRIPSRLLTKKYYAIRYEIHPGYDQALWGFGVLGFEFLFCVDKWKRNENFHILGVLGFWGFGIKWQYEKLKNYKTCR